MFSRLYQLHLEWLRRTGRAFAQANPNTAGMLAEAHAFDPDAARLIEGFSWLSARIFERADAAAPQAIQDLCDIVLPHYASRRLPAASILEFTPTDVPAIKTIPAGTEVRTVPIERTSCRFRTTQPVELLPLVLQHADLENSQSPNPMLRVRFQTTGAGFQRSTDVTIRLFIHSEYAVSTTLWLWLVRHCREVKLRDLAGAKPEATFGPEAIRPVGFKEDEALLPWPRLAPSGYRLLQEYHALPQKFLFVDVRLPPACQIGQGPFELSFAFERAPQLPGRLASDSLRLHCTPVVNLFWASAKPILSELPGAEHLLRPEDVLPAHAEVYSVESVIGIRGHHERTHYSPLSSFMHVCKPGREPEAFYRLRRELVGEGFNTYLSTGTVRGWAPPLAKEVLSVEMTCSNREHAAKVRSGNICVPGPYSRGLSFKNLLPASKPSPPPQGRRLHHCFTRHLALARELSRSPGSLPELLSLYDFDAKPDADSRPKRKRIQSVKMQPTWKPLTRDGPTGTPVRASVVEIMLDESSFASRGEAYLYSCVIEELLASRTVPNVASILEMTLTPSRASYSWPPRNGAQVLT